MSRNKKKLKLLKRNLTNGFKRLYVMRDAVIRDRLDAGKPVDDLLPTNPEELAYLRKKFNLPDQVTPPPPPAPKTPQGAEPPPLPKAPEPPSPDLPPLPASPPK